MTYLFWFLIVYGLVLDFKDTHMQVYKRYIIQYSTIVPYYVKVDHNLTFINPMTLTQMKTKKKGEQRYQYVVIGKDTSYFVERYSKS